jgi:hypothetical protein
MKNKLAQSVLEGLAHIFDYPVEDSAIMARVIFETAELLRKKKKKKSD